MQQSRSIKIAVAAVGASLAAVLILLTRVLPLWMSLLALAAVCYYIVFEKAGIVAGLLCIAAASALGFILGPGAGAFLNLVLFAPYAILTYFIRGFRYDKVKTAAIRAAIIIVFANLIFMAVFFLADAAFKELNLLELLDRIAGGYLTAAVLITLIGIVIDVFFCYACKYICSKIKLGGK